MTDLSRLKIVTPDKIFYEGDAIIVELTTTEGQIGAYANHIPLTATISPGVLEIHEEGQARGTPLVFGFMKTLLEQVIIMTEMAEWLEGIGANRAEETHVRAERRLKKNSAETGTLRTEMVLKRVLTRPGARQ